MAKKGRENMKRKLYKRMPVIVKTAVLLGIFAFCAAAAAPAAARSETVNGREYLQSIGADEAQIAHLEEVWRTW